MSLADLVRAAVTIAADLTVDLQTDVTHTPYGTPSEYGHTPGAAVTRKALVDYRSRLIINPATGQVRQCMATVTFLENVAIDPRDAIVIPGAPTYQIINVSGFQDPAGGRYYTQVALG